MSTIRRAVAGVDDDIRDATLHARGAIPSPRLLVGPSVCDGYLVIPTVPACRFFTLPGMSESRAENTDAAARNIVVFLTASGWPPERTTSLASRGHCWRPDSCCSSPHARDARPHCGGGRPGASGRPAAAFLFRGCERFLPGCQRHVRATLLDRERVVLGPADPLAVVVVQRSRTSVSPEW